EQTQHLSLIQRDVDAVDGVNGALADKAHMQVLHVDDGSHARSRGDDGNAFECPEAGSTMWQAAAWRGLPVANNAGLFSLHTFSANGQRVWKRQPDGGSIGLGGSPVIGASCVRRSGSSEGIAAS